MSSQLCREDYTVGWVCALPVELAAALEMLDEEHAALDQDPQDENIYSLGSVAGHNVVIVCLPAGRIGNNPAAAVATQMKAAFNGIRFGLMVGIGGGVPSAETDIRLGDVVVSKPDKTFGGVVQYDSGKATLSGFERIGSLNSPPQILLAALTSVQANEFRGRSKVAEYIAKLDRMPKFQRDKAGADILFETTYDHEGGPTCDKCKAERQEAREPRDSDEEVVIHYGTIASGNQVIKDARKRDKISADLDGVLCFEMEAAGLMNSFPCLVVRGICDYADSHKNKRWQQYAAGAAAAYAKEVLSVIAPNTVKAERKIGEVLSDLRAVAEDYKNIAKEGLAISQQSLHIQQQAHKQTLSDRQAKCLQLFRLTKSTDDATYERYKERIAERVEGTCMWFLNHSHFQEWKRKESGPLLVSADPGCGKSVLAKYLVDHVLAESSTVCYFFFKDQVQNTVREALCALLHQLFSQKPSLLMHAVKQYDKDGEGLVNSISSLWAVLGNAVQDASAGSITIVLDALDECAESEIKDLMRSVETQVQNSESSNAKLKLFMTSRPYEHVVSELYNLSEAFPRIRIPGEDKSETISQEVNCVIRCRVNQFAEEKDLSDEIKACLGEQLLKMEHRTYLWVYLVFDYLEGCRFKRTPKGMASEFSKLPKNVDQAYEQILNKSKDCSMVPKALAIILAATRPLTLLEMSIAMEVDESTKAIEDLDLEREDDFKSRLRSWCGLFVSIHHGRIYFLHQTAREFLLAELSLSRPIEKALRWHGSITMKDAHTALAECCIRFLSFFDHSDSVTTDQVQSVDKNAFLEYSANSWGLHLRESRICDDAEAAIASLTLKLSDPDARIYSVWSQIFWKGFYPGDSKFRTRLMVACFFGHVAVAKRSLEEGADVNAQGGEYGNALQAASIQGHEQVVRLLVENGADVNVQGGEYGNALHAAVAKNHTAVVELLLNNGADPSRHDSQGKCVLHYATNSVDCNLSLVDLLLSRGAPANTTDINNMTPLLYCVKRGHKSMIELFLDNGLSIDACADRKPWSRNTVKTDALSRSSVSESESDISGTPAGLTPLHFTALTGNLAMTKFLLERGADPNAFSRYNESPMHLTLRRTLHGPSYDDDWTNQDFRIEGLWDLVDIVEEDESDTISDNITKNREGVLDALLADTRTSLTVRDYQHNYPLHCVGYKEPESMLIIQKLVFRGANPFQKNLKQQNALHLASQAGNHDAVAFLISLGVDPALTDNEGLNALHYAAISGNHETITVLLETALETRPSLVASKDDQGRNLLHHLVSNHSRAQRETIQLLLDKGVGGSELDASGNSPLASYFKRPGLGALYVEICQPLLSVKGNALFVDKNGQNLGHLGALAWRCSVEILEMLKEHGVDLTQKDLQSKTILHYFAIGGSLTKESLHYLVHVVGIEINAKDASGKTALQHAADQARKARHPETFDRGRWDRSMKLLLESSAS